ncbi:MAG TPA: 50S ribosomal protein L29 [bacterium]|nr:50S ribosomal protein L29 [bacterium]HMW37253.1 50S ribosomal protein L29 [bacterium]HMY35866.1 50S ribosomal protein L29 [bacterium]HMZ04451.1 50S ribosomal protein L29 [bacterium]HNB09094.1 50S ribosomal protein L29 [bacterium]
MKAHEVRGLPAEELKGMINEAETNLVKMRFTNAVGQLEKKTDLRSTKKEIAIVKTVMREETLKTELAEAAKILEAVVSKHQIKGIPTLKGEKLNTDKAALRKAVRLLESNPKRSLFVKEYKALKEIAHG